jgi:16S rRNA (guanine(966)-N(2))-methyltransferase RsmD
MSVRVIAGIAKGHKLEVPPGLAVRPTPDRAKEALFNILGKRVVDCRFLDLYAGSGAIGIEALSRGAAQVVFVEKKRPIARIIERNLAKTGLAEHATVVSADVAQTLEKMADKPLSFDIIFADPPYKAKKALAILQLIDNKRVLNTNGLVVWEHASSVSVPAKIGKLVSIKDVRYGDTSFAFLS